MSLLVLGASPWTFHSNEWEAKMSWILMQNSSLHENPLCKLTSTLYGSIIDFYIVILFELWLWTLYDNIIGNCMVVLFMLGMMVVFVKLSKALYGVII